MARIDNGIYHNFRLSKSNPQHIKVDKILRDLNPNVVKSKNQYITDAIEYYTNVLDNEDLTVTGAMEKANKSRFVTRGEIDEMKREIRDFVVIDVQKEMLALLGTFTGNMANSFPARGSQQSEVNRNKTEDFGIQEDETINGLASKWG